MKNKKTLIFIILMGFFSIATHSEESDDFDNITYMPSGINIYSEPTEMVDMVLINPEGKKTGIEFETNKKVEEIPSSSHDAFSIDEDPVMHNELIMEDPKEGNITRY